MTLNAASLFPGQSGIDIRPLSASRVEFVDYGKGLCIILVVMMHSVLGVGDAMGGKGWMHYPVEFSRPFRMPDFFLIAGLFLARTIDAPWRRYLDRKVLHFAYFFVLWTAIHLTVKITTLPDPSLTGLLHAFAWRMIEPITPLWFIYLLPICFVVTRLLKKVPWQIVVLLGIGMESFPISGYGIVLEEFMRRFVYFYAGYCFAPQIFRFAQNVSMRPAAAMAGLALWGVMNGLAVFVFSADGMPLAQQTGVSALLGFAGALALVSVAALLARYNAMGFVRRVGSHSIIVFLAFVLFMAPTRILLIKANILPDIGSAGFAVMAAALTGPLLLAWLVAATPFKYLFVRPQWAKLKGAD